MADQSLEILIKTLADTVGVEKVKESLKGLSAEAAATGAKLKNTGDEASASGEASAKSGEQTEKANEKAKQAVDKHAGAHSALRKLARALGQEIPALGAAMQFAFGVAAGSVAVLIMGLHSLAGAIQRIRDRYKEAAEIEAAVWRGSIEGSNAAKDAAEDYAKAVAKIATEVDRAKDKESEELAVLQAMAEARQKILDAQYKAEMAAAGDNEEKKAEIERRYAKKKSAADLKAQEDELRAKEGEMQRRQLEADTARKEADAAAAAKAAGDPAGRARADAAKKWLEQHGSDVETARVATDRAGDPVKMRAIADEMWNDPMASVEDKVIAQDRARRAEEAAKKLNDAKIRESEERAAIKAFEDGEKKREERYNEALDRRKETETRAGQQKSEVETSRRVFDINRKTAAEVNSAEVKEELFRSGYYPNSKLGQTLHGNIEAQEARANGERMTQDQAKSMQQLAAALKAAGNNQKQITQIVTMMMDLTRSHEEKIKELFARLKQQKAQARRPGVNAGG